MRFTYSNKIKSGQHNKNQEPVVYETHTDIYTHCKEQMSRQSMHHTSQQLHKCTGKQLRGSRAMLTGAQSSSHGTDGLRHAANLVLNLRHIHVLYIYTVLYSCLYAHNYIIKIIIKISLRLGSHSR